MPSCDENTPTRAAGIGSAPDSGESTFELFFTRFPGPLNQAEHPVEAVRANPGSTFLPRQVLPVFQRRFPGAAAHLTLEDDELGHSKIPPFRWSFHRFGERCRKCA